MSSALDLRRPQQARSIASRARLLEATIECLVELGHGATTTTAVAKRAGMSQGALFKHFSSKAALMGAATEHLFSDLIEGYRQAFVALAMAKRRSSPAQRLEAALDLLWGVFTDAPLQAAFELYVAARTDEELRSVLAPVMEQHSRNLRAQAADLFPELAHSPRFSAIIRTVMAAMQGAALTAPIDGGGGEELSFLRHSALRELTTASSPPPGAAGVPRGKATGRKKS